MKLESMITVTEAEQIEDDYPSEPCKAPLIPTDSLPKDTTSSLLQKRSYRNYSS